jgi:hypothetical protein
MADLIAKPRLYRQINSGGQALEAHIYHPNTSIKNTGFGEFVGPIIRCAGGMVRVLLAARGMPGMRYLDYLGRTALS